MKIMQPNQKKKNQENGVPRKEVVAMTQAGCSQEEGRRWS